MSGVIDSKGIQWEHCNICGLFTRLEDLGYVKPSENHPNGLDICIKCVNNPKYLHDTNPAPSWNAVYGKPTKRTKSDKANRLPNPPELVLLDL